MWKYICKHRKFPLVITIFAETDEDAMKLLDEKIKWLSKEQLVDLPESPHWELFIKEIV